MARQHRAQRAPASGIDRGAGGILASRGRDDGPRPAAQRAVEPVGIEPAPVDGDGLDRQPEGMHQVGDPRPARVLDDDPVAGPELGLQRALDRVERAAGDRDVAARSRRRRTRPRRGRRARAAWSRRRTACASGSTRARASPSGGSSRGSGLPLARSRTPAGSSAACVTRTGGSASDRRPASTVGRDEATLLERAVGGGHRRRADLERRRERAPSGASSPGAGGRRDLGLDRRRDGCRRRRRLDSCTSQCDLCTITIDRRLGFGLSPSCGSSRSGSS